MPTQLKNLVINEVSSVDRGAGHGVQVKLIKRHASSGTDKTAVAKDAKREALSEAALAVTIKSILGSDLADKAGALTECFKQFATFTDGDEPVHQEQNMPTIQELQKALEDAVAAEVAKMSADHKAVYATLQGDEAKKFLAMSADDRAAFVKAKKEPPKGDDDGDEGDDVDAEKALTKIFGAEIAKAILKAKPKAKAKDGDKDDDCGPMGKVDKATQDRITKAEQEAEKLRKQVNALTEKDQLVQFGKRAVAIGLTEADGDMLLKAHRGDPEALKKMEEKIAALSTQVQKGDLFTEFGDSRTDGTAKSAHDELVGKAAEIRKADGKLTAEQAYVKAMEQNPELAKREERERLAKLNRVAV